MITPEIVETIRDHRPTARRFREMLDKLVITPEIVETIRDHRPTARRFREMLDEGNARYFVSEDIPISVGIVNGAVGINLTDEQGTLKGGVKTDNETVHTWAVNLFENCREQARRMEPEAITV